MFDSRKKEIIKFLPAGSIMDHSFDRAKCVLQRLVRKTVIGHKMGSARIMGITYTQLYNIYININTLQVYVTV